MKGEYLIIASLAVYLAIVLATKILPWGKSKTTAEYFLGGRKAGSWATALGADASNMGLWLLFAIPGAFYTFCTGYMWVGVGLLLGIALNWILVAKRLRRFAVNYSGAITVPGYLGDRFGDKTGLIKAVSSIFSLGYFAVLLAAGLKAGGNLLSYVFDLSYDAALIICVSVIALFALAGGLRSVSRANIPQSLLMLAVLIALPVLAVYALGGYRGALDAVKEGSPCFLPPGTNSNDAMSLISQLGFGLGCFGIPCVLVRFMAARSDKKIKGAGALGIILAVLAITSAVLVGVVGRAYIGDGLEDGELVFAEIINKLFISEGSLHALPIVGGLLLCGLFAAIMSAADSQLLGASSAFSEDFIKGFIFRKAKDNAVIWIGKFAVPAIAFGAYVLAAGRFKDESIFDIISIAWAGFGAAFGPAILLSLYWKRMNGIGAAFGILTGGGTVIFWEFCPVVGGETHSNAIGIYSLVVGFTVSLIVMWVVSLLTQLGLKTVPEAVTDNFNKAVNDPDSAECTEIKEEVAACEVSEEATEDDCCCKETYEEKDCVCTEEGTEDTEEEVGEAVEYISEIPGEVAASDTPKEDFISLMLVGI